MKKFRIVNDMIFEVENYIFIIDKSSDYEWLVKYGFSLKIINGLKKGQSISNSDRDMMVLRIY